LIQTKVIRVNLETYENLINLGTMRDTFDSVINRLIKDAEKWQVIKNEFLKELDGMVYKEESAHVVKYIKQWFKKKGLLE